MLGAWSQHGTHTCQCPWTPPSYKDVDHIPAGGVHEARFSMSLSRAQLDWAWSSQHHCPLRTQHGLHFICQCIYELCIYFSSEKRRYVEFILSKLHSGSHTHGLNYFKALYCGVYSYKCLYGNHLHCCNVLHSVKSTCVRKKVIFNSYWFVRKISL